MGYEYHRQSVLQRFTALGFKSETAFCNVCRSIDNTLSWFYLNQFYNGYRMHPGLISRLESIVEFLKNE